MLGSGPPSPSCYYCGSATILRNETHWKQKVSPVLLIQQLSLKGRRSLVGLVFTDKNRYFSTATTPKTLINLKKRNHEKPKKLLLVKCTPRNACKPPYFSINEFTTRGRGDFVRAFHLPCADTISKQAIRSVTIPERTRMPFWGENEGRAIGKPNNETRKTSGCRSQMQ